MSSCENWGLATGLLPTPIPHPPISPPSPHRPSPPGLERGLNYIFSQCSSLAVSTWEAGTLLYSSFWSGALLLGGAPQVFGKMNL